MKYLTLEQVQSLLDHLRDMECLFDAVDLSYGGRAFGKQSDYDAHDRAWDNNTPLIKMLEEELARRGELFEVEL